MSADIKLLGVSGSLRSGSFSTAVLAGLKRRMPSGVNLDILTLNDIPPYNGDLEGERLPEAVRGMKTRIAEADGLVVSSPEYNYSTSGVLKNALDWASRPGFNSPLKNKPALIITSSPGTTGGVRAHAHLRDTLSAILCRVVARPQVVIAGVGGKVQNGELVDEDALKFSLAAIDDLLAEIGLVKKG